MTQKIQDFKNWLDENLSQFFEKFCSFVCDNKRELEKCENFGKGLINSKVERKSLEEQIRDK